VSGQTEFTVRTPNCSTVRTAQLKKKIVFTFLLFPLKFSNSQRFDLVRSGKLGYAHIGIHT